MHNLAWHTENVTEKQSNPIVNMQAQRPICHLQMENDWNDGELWSGRVFIIINSLDMLHIDQMTKSIVNVNR